MEVEFEFAAGQQTYRIIRKHSKPKSRRASGQTILELQIAGDNGFRSITGNSIQQTQGKIIEILRMNYDTFQNSAYLRQGHADEFTLAKPADRKQVLVDILGLSVYDELESKAKELAKQREAEEARLASAIEDINNELAQKPGCEAELEQALDKLTQIEQRISEQESHLTKLRQQKESLESKRAQLDQLEKHTAETTRTLEQFAEQIKRHNSQIKGYEELIAQRSTIEEGFAQLMETRKLNEEFNQKLKMVNTLNERKHQLEMTILQSSQALNREHALAESKMVELETINQKLPRLRHDLQQVRAELNRLAEAEEVLKKKRLENQELRAHIREMETNKSRLEQEIAEIAEKLNLLVTQTDARCPLCDSELGADGLKHLRMNYTNEKQTKAEALKSNESKLAEKLTGVRSLEAELSQLEAKINQDKASAQSKASILGQGISEAEKAGKQLDDVSKRLAEIEEHLVKKDFVTIEQDALNRLENELTNFNYNPEQHEQIRQSLTSLEQYENPKQRLEEADRLINREKESIIKAEQATKELRQSLELENKKKQELIIELSTLSQLTVDLAQAEIEHQRLSTQQQQAQEMVGSVKGKLQHCAELEIKKKEKEQQLSQISKEKKIYQDLAQAFGKKGIQALLIEMALPEIENEANKLLGRMTDNRMHVKIETQRETKKGEVVETLDINTSDELGMRNYEMFSGGEAFRINFAIRIALSKLLAKRAGAPLPTLIIDEGFGTQDNVGIEKLKEAIKSIQDDFEKILVITHIEELKDAFPTRIDVIKTSEGSTIEVN